MQQLQLFGSASLTDGDTAITKLRPKSLLLLAFFAIEQTTYTRSRLVDLFWPTQAEKQGRRNLSWTLNNIKTYAGNWLKPVGDGVAFVGQTNATVDCLLFETLATSAESSDLQTAVDLYHGPFLTTLNLADLPELESWQLRQRERWLQAFSSTLGRLATALGEQNKFDDALAVARRRLALDDWRESSHRQLIDLLQQAGRYEEALAQYEHCRQLLASELGTAPTQETNVLVEHIREQLHSQTSAAAPAGNLVQSSSDFFGRNSQLKHLTHLLQQTEQRLVTITGMGGSGKTTLAQAVGHAVHSHFADGVWFVPLFSLNSVSGTEVANRIVETIIATLGLPQGGKADSLTRLIHYFSNKKVLLVLDNFEHLLPDTSLVEQLLKALPHLRILVTSRERLGLRSEHQLPLDGLQVAGADAPAIQLLRCRLPLGLDVLDSAELQQLVTLTGGLPLAIELCAAALEFSSSSQLLELLSADVGVLNTPWRDVPERHRSLALLFEQTWQLMPPELGDILGKVALFSADFDTRAACTIIVMKPQQLQQLVHQSLLQLKQHRYTLHPLLRQWILERQPASVASASHFHRRHADYYLTFANQQLDAMQSGQRTVVKQSIGNVRQAWRWAVANAQTDLIDLGIDALVEFALGDVNLGTTLALLEAAAEQTDDIALRHRLINSLGKLHQEQRSTVLEPRLLKMLEVGSDSAEIARTHYLLGAIASRRGQTAAAISSFETALAQFSQLNNRLGMLQTLRGQATAMLRSEARDMQLAWRLLTRSLRLARELEDAAQIAYSLEGMGNWATLAEDYPLAITSFREALALFRLAGNVPSIIENLLNIGSLEYKLQHKAKAEQATSEALHLARAAGLRERTTQALANLGELQVVAGQHQTGWVHIREALGYAVADHNRHAQLWLCVIMGNCLSHSSNTAHQQLAANLLASVIEQDNIHPFLKATAQKFATSLPTPSGEATLQQLLNDMLSPLFSQPFHTHH